MAETPIPETIPLYTPNQQALLLLGQRLDHKPWLPLGIYYENLWHFILEQHPDFQLVTHNLQVASFKNGIKQTLGEYDLIYRLNGQAYHRELAVKFYLGLPLSKEPVSPWHHWVGPGLKDRLDRKMQRMCNHQITLSDTPEGKQTLAAQGIFSVTKEILIQGRLFYPVFAQCPPPLHAHPDHLRGYWLTLAQCEQWLSRQPHSHRGQILSKPFWLNNETLSSNMPSQTLLQRLNNVPLPALLKHHNEYYFIVPENWQHQAIPVVFQNATRRQESEAPYLHGWSVC